LTFKTAPNPSSGLTDNDVQLGDMPQHHSGPTARYKVHKFDSICIDHEI